jgi:hypothetical protein
MNHKLHRRSQNAPAAPAAANDDEVHVLSSEGDADFNLVSVEPAEDALGLFDIEGPAEWSHPTPFNSLDARFTFHAMYDSRTASAPAPSAAVGEEPFLRLAIAPPE